MKTTKLFTLTLFVLALVFSASAYANLELNRIYYDPAIVAAGDTVDIIIEYETKNTPFDSSKIGSEEYSFEVTLKSDDDMTREYITILDSQGDHIRGQVLQGVVYNRVFRVKVDTNAPTAPYQFKLEGQWHKNGNPVGYSQTATFEMNVKKEGIILDIASLQTVPSKIRPGDDNVEIKAFVDNSGFKDAKSIELQLTSSEEITPSFSDNNRVWVGQLDSLDQKEVSFFIDVEDGIKSGVYTLTLKSIYMDLDNNEYAKNITIPLRIHAKPELVIEKYYGEGKAGEQATLNVVVKNVGEQSAEAVDVRIVKQSTQPFAFDVRSDYIGELEPNETGTAIFTFNVLDDAKLKTHNFELFLRAKGDSDEGDNTIYTYTRDVEFDVTGKAPNYFIIAGMLLVIIVAGLFGFKKLRGKK